MKKEIKLHKEFYYVCEECDNQEFEVEHYDNKISLYCPKCSNRKILEIKDL